jgi:uncharacterized protein YidB (DUF937 family)
MNIRNWFRSTRVRVVAGALALLIVGGVLGFVVSVAMPAFAAARNGNVAVATTPTTTANAYCTLYEQTLAKELGVSVSTLESDNINAIKAVIDQAVKDGKITQAQATTIENKLTADGTNVCSHIGGILGGHKGGFGHAGAAFGALGQIRTAIQTAVATKLGYANAAALQTALANTDIVSLAKTKGVSQATLNATISGAVKTQLDTLVKNGTITSQMETNLISMVTSALNAGQYGIFGLGKADGHFGFGPPPGQGGLNFPQAGGFNN